MQGSDATQAGETGSKIMETSQNGWAASDNAAVIRIDREFHVQGVSFPGGVREGITSLVLGYVVEQVHNRVEKLHSGWCWGWYYRPNRNDPTSLSNHSSGTAVDFNAPAHPNGVPTGRTWKPWQVQEIHKILREVDNVVRWGGDYQITPDSMHFEINASKKEVLEVARRLRRGEVKPCLHDRIKGRIRRKRRAKALRTGGLVHIANVKYGQHNSDVAEVQKVLNAWYPHHKLKVDGVYGRHTNDLLDFARKAFDLHAPVDKSSIARRRTLRLLGFKVIGKD